MAKECKDIKELLSEYLDECLTDHSVKEVEDHLSKCKSCKSELKYLIKTINTIKNLPKYPAPSNILVSINKKIEERKTLFQRIIPVGLKISLGSVALILISLLVLQLYRYDYPEIKKTETRELRKLANVKTKAPQETLKKQEDENRDKMDRKLEAGKPISAPPASPSMKAERAKAIAVGKKEQDKRVMSIGTNGMSLVVKDAESKKELSVMNEPLSVTKKLYKVQQKVFKEKKGAMCDYKLKANLVIKNNEEWSKVWQKAFPDEFLLTVDFNSNMVIAVFLGEKPSIGFEVDIKEIKRGQDKIIVTVKETVPAEVSATVLTCPYHIKVIDKSDLPVEFIKE